MGLTGVIYAMIVVAWAAYLVPMALRRHDEAARTRSVERFSSAMRVLSRRESTGDDRMVVTPARQGDRLLIPSLKPSDDGAMSRSSRPSRAAQRAAVARRRMVLIALGSLTAATVAVSAFAVIPWWSFAVPLVSVLAFLVVARRQVRRVEEAFWLEAAQHRPEPSNVVRRTAARVDAAYGAVKSAVQGSEVDRSADDEPTVTLSAKEIAVATPDLTQGRVTAIALPTADGGSLWDPLPITLPTYVDKPAAKRTIRTIELGDPGTWSAGHDEDASRTAAEATQEPTERSVEEPRRAVNG
ncbi:MAG: hypothetical protein H0T17_04645 [Propionibacteriales bacterium]|nr:hypothetical protein [Propionibacteriales bacterium]